MNTDTDRHCIDLTQLSSREQLSALMDGALPEDQTRFLLRRLQHDTELADSWDRWRIAAEAMRGLAPGRHLPADFALRVSAALHGDSAAPAAQQAARSPGWLRWGSGVGMAAALAVVALMARPALQGDSQPTAVPAAQHVASMPASAPVPMPQAPAPASRLDAPAMLAATAAVAVAKPVRRAASRPQPAATVPAAADVVAPTDRLAVELPAATPLVSAIATRPWPRSILPQYSGSNGLTVGFGEHVSRAAATNPFAPPVFSAPPKLLRDEEEHTDAPAPVPQTPAEPSP